MAPREQFLGGVTKVATASATNATATVTVNAAGSATANALYVTGFMISASAAPASAVQATMLDQGSTLFPIQIPAAAFAPIVKDFGNRPLRITPGNTAGLSVPALGSGVVCTVTLFYTPGTA